MLNPPEYTEPLKISWAKECFTGAILSAVFTVMAQNSGAEGVVEGDISDKIHQIIIIGGITMAVICATAGVAITLRNVVVKMMRQTKSSEVRHAGFFAPLRTARFLNIFLP